MVFPLGKGQAWNTEIHPHKQFKGRSDKIPQNNNYGGIQGYATVRGTEGRFEYEVNNYVDLIWIRRIC